jgi:PAS domain S-box-containing protein
MEWRMSNLDSFGADLVVNLALLICLTFVYAALRRWLPAERSPAASAAIGVWFGAIALLGMQMPVHLGPGVYIDGRTVIVALAAPFGGWVAAIVAASLTGAYRLYLGGSGAVAGTGMIITAALLGILALRLRPKRTSQNILLFCLFLGLALCAVNILWAFAVPDFRLTSDVFWKVMLPLGAGFTTLTMLLGFLLDQYDSLQQSISELEETKDKLKQYGDASGEWFWDQDADLRFIESPLGKLPDIKYNFSGRLGSTRWEVVAADPDNDPHWRAHRNDLLNRRPFRDFEYAAGDRDGNKLVIRTTGYPIFDGGGAFAGYRGTSRDVTDEVARREKALAAEKLLSAAVQGLDSAIALYDADDRLVVCNDFYRELVEPCADLLVPGATFETILRALADSGAVTFTDLDKEAWLEWRLAEHANPSGPTETERLGGRSFLQHEQRLPGGETVLVILEITERRKAEEALRESEERYRNLTEGSLQGIGILQDDKIAFVNGAFARILGYLPEDTIGQSIDEFVMPEYQDLVNGRRAARLRGEDVPAYYDLQARHRDGHGIWIDQLVQPVIWQGRPAVQISIVDISQRKEAEAAVVVAKEEAEHANRAKSEFLAHFSHELRTPLNAIIGFSEIMQQQLFGPLGDARYLDYANDIHQSGAHLLALISDILDFSRIEAGQLGRDERIFDVGMVAEDCIRLLNNRAKAKGVQLELSSNEPGLRLVADERQTRQMILNLLSNAVKFTRPDSLVTLAVEIGEDGDVSINVGDAGDGMSAEDIVRVQEPFIRLDSALTSSEEGTGLGLAITKRLAESHGGSLRLNSALGEGTMATVCFPSTRVANANF